MDIKEKTDAFERARPQLMGIAYRLLGAISEAEDAVQDTAYKWFSGGFSNPDTPTAWLSAMCTNRCLDVLKSAQRKRMEYVGPWFPEQFQTEATGSPEEQLEISSSLSTAFLLLLERLTPKERAAYLLHDIFSMSFADVSVALGISNETCRKLASRARKMIAEERVRFTPSVDTQTRLLRQFQRALSSGDAGPLISALSEDVSLRADSGGKVAAIRHVLFGSEKVMDFITSVLAKAWSGADLRAVDVNGQPSLIAEKDGTPIAAVSLAFSEGNRIKDIYILRNPAKLSQLVNTPISVAGFGMVRSVRLN
jgi:RNA polymerase sigma factor (sigma-70 family)